MTTILLLACYLPIAAIAAIPALLPYRVIRPLRGNFLAISLVPVGLWIVMFAMEEPLVRYVGYPAVLIPLLITYLSFAIAVTGIKLIWHARREGDRTTTLMVSTVLAGVPLMIAAPSLLAEALFAVRQLTGA